MFLVLGGKKVGFQLTDLTRTNVRGRNANMITEPEETNDEHMERFSLVRGYCIRNTFFFFQPSLPVLEAYFWGFQKILSRLVYFQSVYV